MYGVTLLCCVQKLLATESKSGSSCSTRQGYSEEAEAPSQRGCPSPPASKPPTHKLVDFNLSCTSKMPSSDYTNAIGGGLKLKGAKDAGVDKKKKKKKSKSETTASKDTPEELAQQSAVQKALAEEETDDVDAVTKQQELDDKEYGKTEAQRRHEERRRKRVR